MGYLHEGHLSLVHASKAENAATAVSIFVNPTQFGPNEDFERYPRDEERDLRLLREAGVDAVYLPSVDDIYPASFQTYVSVEEVTKRLEGEIRPGHLRRVTTVVLNLINACEPTTAKFGRKDEQQLRVIQRMVRDLDLAVEIRPCAIVREADGLAMSSRNVYLSPEQRAAAPVIQQSLQAARKAFREGTRDASALREIVRMGISATPLAQIDYVSLADDTTLDELDGDVTAPALFCVFARFGPTRLLDNLELDP
jgi:pantoate--beta-alanine ligase